MTNKNNDYTIDKLQKQETFDNESWLKKEFDQNFIHLRDRDDKINGMSKFYMTLVLSVGSVSIGLLGLENLNDPFLWVGLLLIFTCLVGEIIFVWMTAFRIYFVYCARQLNAIRRFYSEFLPSNVKSWVIVQPTDPSFPRMLRMESSHSIVLSLMTFINAGLIAIGSCGVSSTIPSLETIFKILISCLLFLIIIITNFIYVFKKFTKGDTSE